MSATADIEGQSTELLRTLIRNGCVNTGEESSGHEDRSCDALEDFFAGSGLSCERYTSSPGRDEPHHADRGQRQEGAHPPAHGPHRRGAGEPVGMEARSGSPPTSWTAWSGAAGPSTC